MIIDSISEIVSPPLFYKLLSFVSGSVVVIKLEGLNIAGSIKLTTARGMIESLEKTKRINAKTKIVESSSGNLGLALSIVCKEKGYPFVCVTDPNILPENERLIQLYGASLIKITEKDANGGYLASRIAFIHKMLEKDPDYIWLNQYANRDNPNAHYTHTAEEILQEFPQIDWLFIGAGTTGTLMGCAKKFKEKSPTTKIVAVDAAGSVTFGFPAKKRYIPGIGTSRRPEIVDETFVDEILLVDEKDGVKMCRWMLQHHGLFFGGSSGSVLYGVYTYRDRILPGSTVMTISPDFGYKYMNTIYDNSWIQEKFGLDSLTSLALPE